MSKFIIIEGPDFCGKSTQLDLLKVNTWNFGKSFYFTREPGSYLPESALQCERIRERILTNNNSPIEEAELFAKSRYFHTKEIIKLMQEQDCVVVSDRYIVSSLAYQGYAQQLGADLIYELNRETLDLLEDNDIEIHCIKFNINEDEWNVRRKKRLFNEEADSIEQKDIHSFVLDFFTNDNVFKQYTKRLNMQIHNIDASNNKLVVFMEFLGVIGRIVNS